MDRKKSVVWKFFNKLDDKFVKCTMCNKEYKYSGNTTNLNDHLKRKHEKELTKVTEGEGSSFDIRGDLSCENDSGELPAKKSRQSIKSYLNRNELYGTNSNIKNHLDKLYVEMIAIDMMSYRTSEHQGMQRFVQALNNKYQLPSKHL